MSGLKSDVLFSPSTILLSNPNSSLNVPSFVKSIWKPFCCFKSILIVPIFEAKLIGEYQQQASRFFFQLIYHFIV